MIVVCRGPFRMLLGIAGGGTDTLLTVDAITLGVGILTTLFTAFTLTRLIVAYWVRMWRPRTVPI